MTIRTTLKAGGRRMNHNEALKVRTSVRGGIVRRPWGNHNETFKVRAALKAGRARA
jgi:hypothetical protein